eukprot:3320724-Prymnesium_polylepis.1
MNSQSSANARCALATSASVSSSGAGRAGVGRSGGAGASCGGSSTAIAWSASVWRYGQDAPLSQAPWAKNLQSAWRNGHDVPFLHEPERKNLHGADCILFAAAVRGELMRLSAGCSAAAAGFCDRKRISESHRALCVLP